MGGCAADDLGDPVGYGRCQVTEALLSASISNADVQVTTADAPIAAALLAQGRLTLDARPESFVIATVGPTTFVIGRDASGAMYGAQELAEQIALDGAAALSLPVPIARAPRLAIRASNPFLVLPEPGDTNWWFLDDSFWREYLDLMARARINYLDLHGMYNLGNTVFPNALLYFATSATYPDVGVPAADRQRNLAMLNKVIAMAAARGIHVGLMSYRADASLTGDDPSVLTDDAAIKTYTREAATDLATRAPGLWRLGFRIGESLREATWYNDTFVAGVHAAGTGVRIATRTWGAKKPDILSIVGAAGNDTIVEAKFNGEQLGTPYAVAGGLFSIMGGYSYQDFLNAPAPYQFVFQLRAGGTHRIFRYASFERTRRTVEAVALSPAVRGFTLEPPHAYYPARDYYHANAADRFSTWTFRRDELAYLLFGRLGFDPTTPERVFRRALAARVGTDALWDAIQAASDIVPRMQTAHTCGIDSRDAAPELELAGDVAYWASPQKTGSPSSACVWHEAMDMFSIALPADVADDVQAGQATTRQSPLQVAQTLMADAARTRAALPVDGAPMQAEARDVIRECHALADLGLYFAHKLRAATALAVYQRGGTADFLEAARNESAASTAARRQLADDTRYIKAFEDNLRMAMLGLPSFHWSTQLSRMDEDAAAIAAVAQSVAATPPPPLTAALPPAATWLDQIRPAGPGLGALDVSPADPTAPAWTVTATLAAPVPVGARVHILWKPFASETDWQSVDAAPGTTPGTYQAAIAGGGQGGLFAVEVTAGSVGWRYPDPDVETPYRVLAP